MGVVVVHGGGQRHKHTQINTIHLMGKKWCFLLKAGPFFSVKVVDAKSTDCVDLCSFFQVRKVNDGFLGIGGKARLATFRGGPPPQVLTGLGAVI